MKKLYTMVLAAALIGTFTVVMISWITPQQLWLMKTRHSASQTRW